MAVHCSCKTVLNRVFTGSLTHALTLPPAFLIPAFAASQTSSFSSTPSTQARKDGNPSRGVSALRRTGLNKRQKLSVKLEKLPKPVLDPSKRSEVQVDENHGLWEFFPADRKAMATPGEMSAHGRAWTVAELRNKDWDDLHRLWWVCLKEANRLRTYEAERERIGNMYGGHESNARKVEISKTMKAIKHTLTERWYTWDNARNEAMQDEEINMYADLDKGEPAYLPKTDDFEADVQLSSGQNDSSIPPPDAQRPTGEARF